MYILGGLLVAVASVTVEALTLARWLWRLTLCAIITVVATLLVQRASTGPPASQRTVVLLVVASLVCTAIPGAVGWVMHRRRTGLRFMVVLATAFVTFAGLLVCDLVECFAGRCSI